MEKVLKFLKDNPVFFLATAQGDQPRVRPFGAVLGCGGKLYLCTNNRKKVFEQIRENPKIEICGFDSRCSEWLRLQACAAEADNRELRVRMLEEIPALRDVYHPDDGLFTVLELSEITAAFWSMHSPEPLEVVSF